ncbi:glycosyl hydrolase 53 family protein [Desertivirga xinjiangensis]|uniref:glycosyl hydrolase 53 family protein n=1 Tax=Desertivirga xinjiangensis TaxID=539206 RepID=UPI00210BA761|nr:glycosyl hydrolase 53 family protein [Pedobacter xinjiangensis]
MNNFAQLLNSGYDAVKAIDPLIKVIVHLSNGYDNTLFRWMFDGLKNNSAKWDVIGMSLYPSANDWQTLNAQCLANMNDMVSRYGKEVMIAEIGMPASSATESKAFIADLLTKVRSVPEGKALGVFYWEPQAYNGWQGYGKGAFDDTGKPTIAMDAFLENVPLVNHVLNPGFDADNSATQTPQAWTESGEVAASSTKWGNGWNPEGNYSLGHWLATAYKADTYQTIFLPNGTYKLSAFAVGGANFNKFQMYAKGFGSQDISIDISASSTWKEVSIPVITVTTGQITIGFHSDANAGGWMNIDKVSLTVNTTLPVRLKSFKANRKANGIDLVWQTLSEQNNQYFILERSSNGKDFEQIGLLEGNGNKTSFSEYQFTDHESKAGSNYYKLSQVDFNGHQELLGLTSVSGLRQQEQIPVIYPNPARNEVFIKFPEAEADPIRVQLFSTRGELVSAENIASGKDVTRLNLQGLNAGLYFLKIIYPGYFSSRPLLVNN